MKESGHRQPSGPPSSDERWQEIEELARAALARDDADRVSFLDAACPDDPWLRDKALELVRTYDRAGPSAGTVLLRPDFVPPPAIRVEPGDVLGPYRLLELIGEGAMAKVYRASRRDGAAEGSEERLVAVKVAQHGLDLSVSVRLFQVESEILGRLDHPNVLRFVADGTLDDGRPYIVAEFVDGLPIDRYCDRHELDLDGRLEVFRQACAAVEHVHRHQVVHRDIKPRNLLVTNDGVAKLVDFGIAVPLEAGSAAPGPPTERPMTPPYASPEQVRGREITARSDVYSLGVVLYELTTGRLPYGDRESVLGPREMARLLDRGDPPRPSAAAGSSETGRRLRGELDEVILRALAKQPEKRTESAEKLAEDLRAARPPTPDRR